MSPRDSDRPRDGLSENRQDQYCDTVQLRVISACASPRAERPAIAGQVNFQFDAPRPAIGHAVAAPPTSPMTPRRFKSHMESPLLPTDRPMAWWRSQSTAVRSVSQAGGRVLGAILNCSESTLRVPAQSVNPAITP